MNNPVRFVDPDGMEVYEGAAAQAMFSAIKAGAQQNRYNRDLIENMNLSSGEVMKNMKHSSSKRPGTIYVQQVGETTAGDVARNDAAMTEINSTFEMLNINLRAEWHSSNHIMTKEEFFNRQGGSTPFDSYVLIGKAEHIKAKHSEVEDGGWDAPDIGYINGNGISSQNDFISYINLDHINRLKEAVAMNAEINWVSSVHKLALLIQHESLHPKTFFLRDIMRYPDIKKGRLSRVGIADSNGHWGYGLMADYDITSGTYDSWMIQILQWLHNY
jgi:hypothetical protein